MDGSGAQTTGAHNTPAKNEKTGKSVGSIASKGLRTGKLTQAETRKVSATALTQRPDKPKGSTKK